VVEFFMKTAIVQFLTEKSTYEVRKVGHVEFVGQRGDDIRRAPSFLNIKAMFSLRSRPKLVLTWAAPKRDITLYDSQRVVDSGRG
jgi:hypothetical protein